MAEKPLNVLNVGKQKSTDLSSQRMKKGCRQEVLDQNKDKVINIKPHSTTSPNVPVSMTLSNPAVKELLLAVQDLLVLLHK